MEMALRECDSGSERLARISPWPGAPWGGSAQTSEWQKPGKADAGDVEVTCDIVGRDQTERVPSLSSAVSRPLAMEKEESDKLQDDVSENLPSKTW